MGVRFGSTYEGLKPENARIGSYPTASFGSTYEGLKRAWWTSTSMLTAGFGSTYEGLKPRTTPAGYRRRDLFWQYL